MVSDYISLFSFYISQQQNPYVFLKKNFTRLKMKILPIDPLVGEANSQRDQKENAPATTGIVSTGEFLKKFFGILVNRWCVFLSTILLPSESVRSLMHAAIVLNS